MHACVRTLLSLEVCLERHKLLCYSFGYTHSISSLSELCVCDLTSLSLRLYMNGASFIPRDTEVYIRLLSGLTACLPLHYHIPACLYP